MCPNYGGKMCSFGFFINLAGYSSFALQMVKQDSYNNLTGYVFSFMWLRSLVVPCISFLFWVLVVGLFVLLTYSTLAKPLLMSFLCFFPPFFLPFIQQRGAKPQQRKGANAYGNGTKMIIFLLKCSMYLNYVCCHR